MISESDLLHVLLSLCLRCSDTFLTHIFLAIAFKRWHWLHRVIATRLRKKFSVERHRRVLWESKQKDTNVYQTDSKLCVCGAQTAIPPQLVKTNTTTCTPPQQWSEETVRLWTSLPNVPPRSCSDPSLPLSVGQTSEESEHIVFLAS